MFPSGLFSRLRGRARRKPEGDVGADCSETKPASELFEHGIRELQCGAIEHSENAGRHHYEFEFQGGTFIADTLDKVGAIAVCFPGVGEWSQGDSAKVARVCNELSQSTFGTNFTCRQTEAGKVVVDIHSTIWALETMSITRVLLEVFKVMFTMQRHICEVIDQADDDRSIAETYLDRTLVGFASLDRELKLLEEDGGNTPPGEVVEYEEFTIGDLLDDRFHVTRPLIGSIEIDVIKDDGSMTRVGGEEAVGLSPAAMVNAGETALTFVCRFTAMEEARRRVLVLRAESGENEAKRGLQASFTMVLLPERAIQPMDTVGSSKGAAMTTFSMLPPGRGKGEHNAEFKFMRDDAVDKIKEGRENELTEAQRSMIMLDVTDIDYCVYMGTKAFTEERYARAVYYLNPAARKLLQISSRLSHEQVIRSGKVLYMAGVANSMIGDVERAYYFLEPLSQSGNPYYAMALINALSKSGDFRARVYIEQILQRLEDLGEPEDGNEDQAEVVAQFNVIKESLMQELVVQYIKDEQFDEAETILMSMKNGPSSDFAERMLREISRRRDGVD
ncbi:MAG: hypothetical protein J1E84_06655 [Muribaculaceae bacterium]|nr:hypothetical protein [Muribaculaceae bacterium]